MLKTLSNEANKRKSVKDKPIKETSYKLKKYSLGIDIGGTKVEVAIADIQFSQKKIDILARNRFLVKEQTTSESLIADLLNFIEELVKVAQININQIESIGLGLPGTIHPESMIMLNGNTQFLINVPFVNLLKTKFIDKFKVHIDIVAANDANLFTLAETFMGVGLDYESQTGIAPEQQAVVGITLGTGVGGGYIQRGQMVLGAVGSALEVGHVSLDLNGRDCYCGKKGCSESYLSGTALNKRPPFYDSFQLLKNGALNSEAQVELVDYRSKMIHFLSILNNLFNPHYFVFGGGLSNQNILFENLKEELKKYTFLPQQYCPEMMINKLGDSSGVFGAMIYAKKNSLDKFNSFSFTGSHI